MNDDLKNAREVLSAYDALVDDLRAENARLREALETIANREPWKGRNDYDRDDAGLADYWSDMAKEFQAGARAALKSEVASEDTPLER